MSKWLWLECHWVTGKADIEILYKSGNLPAVGTGTDAAGAVCLARICRTAAQEAADSRPRGLGRAVFLGIFCVLRE